jgi:hypothetical protein
MRSQESGSQRGPPGVAGMPGTGRGQPGRLRGSRHRCLGTERLRVEDHRTCRRQGSRGDPVVVSAQQQVCGPRPTRGRRYDRDDRRLGRAAAGAVRGVENPAPCRRSADRERGGGPIGSCRDIRVRKPPDHGGPPPHLRHPGADLAMPAWCGCRAGDEGRSAQPRGTFVLRARCVTRPDLAPASRTEPPPRQAAARSRRTAAVRGATAAATAGVRPTPRRKSAASTA